MIKDFSLSPGYDRVSTIRGFPCLQDECASSFMGDDKLVGFRTAYEKEFKKNPIWPALAIFPRGRSPGSLLCFVCEKKLYRWRLVIARFYK